MRAALFPAITLLAMALYGETPTSISVSPSNVILYSSETQQYAATCTYSDASTDDCTKAGGVTWRVTDARHGTITPGGLFTAGTSTLTSFLSYVEAAVGTVYGYSYLAVLSNGITVSSVYAVSPINGATATVGTTIWASARLQLSSGSYIALARPVSYTSSNTNVATVDRHGHITCLAAGSTTLTATAHGYTKSVTLNVQAQASSTPKTWYVRPGGGSRYHATSNPTGQCDGLHDADYPGSGVNQPCAYSSWKWLWLTPSARSWAISGGDTVIIRQNPTGAGNNVNWVQTSNGPYDPGYDSGYADFSTSGSYNTCAGSGSSACTNPPIPAGSATNPTKIYGENWGACTTEAAKTQIYGVGNVGTVLNLDNTAFVEIRCMGVSDRSSCQASGPTASHLCTTGTDSYGKNGISVSSTTANLMLTDVDVHGLAANGWLGIPGEGVTLARVRFAGNHSAGMNMDPGSTYVQGGGFTASKLLIEWSGCSEQYPVSDALPYDQCTDQTSTGYGDGIGTADTGGTWTISNSVFRYNTQDGVDLLHAQLPGATFSIDRSKSYGNMGQQYKLGIADAAHLTNSYAGTFCRRMSGAMDGAPSTYNTYLSDFCRANGTGIAIMATTHSKFYIYNNTIAGNGNIYFEVECADSYGGQTTGNCVSSDGGGMYFNNNIMRGWMKGYGYDRLPTAFYLGNGASITTFQSRTNNIIHNMRTDDGTGCNAGYTAETCDSPGFVAEPNNTDWTAAYDQTLWDGLDVHLAQSSIAIGVGTPISGITTDLDGATRPSPPSIGAHEYASAGLAVITASLNQGEVGVSYTQTIAANGGTAPYDWAVTAGTLPAGMRLSNSGALSGSPGEAGSFGFTVSVTDSQGVIATRDYTLVITQEPAILTLTLPGGTIDEEYSQTLTASGGTTPYNWSVISGSLPDGLTLSGSGVLSGTPTSVGTYTFAVWVLDAMNGSAFQEYTLEIAPAETVVMGMATRVSGAARMNGRVVIH